MRGHLQKAVLHQLHKHQHLNARDLVGMTGSFVTTVREALARLHRSGLLEQSKAADRSNLYSLSEKGKNTVIAEQL